MQDRRPCVVLTGAGISTESGIPDFRSPTGIWAKYDPQEYATIYAFLADPAKVWEFYGKRLAMLGAAEPNDGHRALAELEGGVGSRAVITQNIDRLHERAGSRALVEVHGSIRTASCLACGAVVTFDEVVELLRPRRPRARLRRGSSSRTSSCSASCCREAAIDSRVELAGARADARRRLLARGLPGRRPAAGDPRRGRRARDRQPGATPFDSRASVTIDSAAGETLRALADALPERA